MALDPQGRRITLPQGTRLDLGGIAKGWIADRALRHLARWTSGAAVDAGGDCRVIGDGPEGPGWLVDIVDPSRPWDVVATLRLVNRGVATSGAIKRRWRVCDREVHHLIDPRSARSSDSDMLTATVVASSAATAEVHAKVAYLLGCRDGLAYLDRGRLCGLIVGRDGSVTSAGGFAELTASEGA